MPIQPNFYGVIPAVVTPFKPNGQIDFKNLQQHIRTLVAEGVSGILLLGTTGEGPSVGIEERIEVIQAGMEVSGGVLVYAGTGTASLTDTIAITRAAFDCGVSATVMIPPFFYKNVKDEGVFNYFKAVLDECIPEDRGLVLYHIPQATAVQFSFDLIEKLLAYGGPRVAGIKDSTGDLEHSSQLRNLFPDLRVFMGDDKLLDAGLKIGAAGSMTAGTNILAPLAVQVYKQHLNGGNAQRSQELLSAGRRLLEGFPPFPPSLKAVLSARYQTPNWEVRPPLVSLTPQSRAELLQGLIKLGLVNDLPWIANLDTK
jgi:4-hydroxy-tetrahydrodipicolinate synthase